MDYCISTIGIVVYTIDNIIYLIIEKSSSNQDILSLKIKLK